MTIYIQKIIAELKTLIFIVKFNIFGLFLLFLLKTSYL
jgi:hypothetical protein